MQVIPSALIQDFGTMQGFLSALIKGSALCKNFQDFLAISTILRSVLFKAAALCKALVYIKRREFQKLIQLLQDERKRFSINCSSIKYVVLLILTKKLPPMMHHFYHSSGRPHHRGFGHPVISGPDSFPKNSNRQRRGIVTSVVVYSTEYSTYILTH